MRIELKGVGKRFRNEWVLREIETAFESPGRYALTGSILPQARLV